MRRPKVSEPDDPRIASALAMLDGGAKVHEVALACGVSDRTVARWRVRHPTIRSQAEKALEAVKVEALSSVTEALKDIAKEAREAVATLVSERDNYEDGTPDSRIRASVALLDRAGIVGGAKVEHSGAVTSEVPDRAALLARLEARTRVSQEGQQTGSDL